MRTGKIRQGISLSQGLLGATTRKVLQHYLIRFSEIGTKAPGTRRYFLRILERNIRDMLARGGVSGDLEISSALRGFLVSDDERAPDFLRRIFGIRSFSAVTEKHCTTPEEIAAEGERQFRERVTGKRFAVRARRAGTHPFTSLDIEAALGERLAVFGTVDLDTPEVVASVEVRSQRIFFFSKVVSGPGGLPLGTQGRALALISGGFDSAVAAWFLMKRGVSCDYCFFNLGGPIHEEGALRVVKTLADRWQYGDDPAIIVVPFAPVVRAIRQRVRGPFWNLVLKRAMLDLAFRIAAERGLEAVMVGDALGQVSSQTLKNLRALGEGPMPILRPLLSFDKDEIVAKARSIGTADLSAAVKEYCALVPWHPVTAASPFMLAAERQKLDSAVLDAAFSERRTLTLRRLTFGAESALAEVATPYIPEGARLIDLREAEEYRQWHAPLAQRLSSADAFASLDRLDSSQPLLFYCTYGLLSAELAYEARKRGLAAWSFSGGVEALRTALKLSNRQSAHE
ncbi:MAG: tRNA 4-thiouridine(8) synthase ThiI [Candidatus Terrybacteria bacterium]|nr:tRNA 4-thiouridine(8) synthase ThiI [Candidatus Terrybacteria bacterium]